MHPADIRYHRLMTHPDQRWTRIEIAKEAMSFSAAHFTIFNATNRENLHGHNFRVACEVSAPLGDDDLCFDYAILKRRLKALCDDFDERMLLPAHSPHLRLQVTKNEIVAYYADEVMRFLPRDVLILPIANITVEALSRHLLVLLIADPAIAALALREMVIKVSSGSGQWGVANWQSPTVNQ